MIQILALHPDVTPESLGLIPHMLTEKDPRDARKQLHDGYSHGGGWQPMPGFVMEGRFILKYPGDEPLKPIAVIQFRDEKIFMYEHSIVAVFQTDGSFEVARMD